MLIIILLILSCLILKYTQDYLDRITKIEEYYIKLHDEYAAKSDDLQSKYNEVLWRVDLLKDDIIEEFDDVVKLVRVTAYSSSNNNKTSSGKKPVQNNTIAVSRDILEKWGYSSKVSLYLFDSVSKTYKNYGVFSIDDTMHSRYKNSMDVYLDSEEEAKNFGVKRGFALIKK